MTIAVGYVRVSTSKQGQSGLSLEAQRDQVATQCQSLGLDLANIYEDVGVSGATPVAGRQGLLAALTEAKALEATHLVVAKLDRLSRSPFILLTIENELGRSGMRISSAAGEGTGDDDPSSVLVRRMLQAVAEHELAMISARTKVALAQKKARGERLGRPPYGFSVVDGDLVPNDDFPMLWQCWHLYVPDTMTMRGVLGLMVEIDPDGGWNLKRVHSILNRWTRKELEIFNGRWLALQHEPT